MTLPLRDLLEELETDFLTTLCSHFELPTSGRRETKISSIARQLDDDYESILELLPRKQLIRALDITGTLEDGREYEFVYVSQANREHLLEMVFLFYATDWEASEEGEEPIEGCRIGVRFLVDADSEEADGGLDDEDENEDEDLLEDDEADDDLEEEYVEERDFSHASMRDRIVGVRSCRSASTAARLRRGRQPLNLIQDTRPSSPVRIRTEVS